MWHIFVDFHKTQFVGEGILASLLSFVFIKGGLKTLPYHL